jgi:hypothetical protein
MQPHLRSPALPVTREWQRQSQHLHHALIRIGSSERHSGKPTAPAAVALWLCTACRSPSKTASTSPDFRPALDPQFYAARQPAAAADSWVAARLRDAGAVIIGKAHLHQLAYGVTGENRDYGDCLQPADPALLTGGSSSGAAASIQEGSALAAIGTDTGGSVRAPAALCGLTGYRASLGIGDWTGGYHLAPSFDTIGWLCRDLRDLPLLGRKPL